MASPDLSRMQVVEMAVYNTAGLTASYAGMNLAASYLIYTGDGFPDSIKILKYYNGSNVGITISYDGVTRQDYLPPGATQITDLQSNHADNSAYGSGTLNGAQGQIVYGKGSAGTGSLYIVGYR